MERVDCVVVGAGVIGLAIAREIVVAHGGSIACTSQPGEGAEFHFLLLLSDGEFR